MTDLDIPMRLPSMRRMPDADAGELMLRVKSGDSKALELLMERYWSGLVRYASQMLGSIDAAADVAQEVFVRVWQHRARWEPRGSVEAYLYQIARNLVLLDLRQRDVRDRTELEVRTRARKVSTPLENTAHGELQRALERALGKLPERRREAILLVRVDGLPLAEAAAIMGVTKRTVANHVHMAVSELEQALLPFLR